MSKVEQEVAEIKRMMCRVQDKIEDTADLVKGTAFKDHLDSIYDALEDLRFDLGKQLEEHKRRVRGEGGGTPKSWRESA